MFAPALNARSMRLAQARRAKELAGSLQGSPGRPASPSYARPRRSVSPRHAPCVHAEEADCTFAPAVGGAVEAVLERAGIPASFDERQQYYRERREVRASCSTSLSALGCACARDCFFPLSTS
jgi:hypothetical protein